MDLSSLRERTSPTPISVAELNNFIKNIFDSNKALLSVTVKGEISNFTNHRSGHLYFSLKDSESQIKAVMFKSSAMRLKFMPESGMKVIAHGSVSVYSRDGSYQLYVNSLQPDGIGDLYLAYEQLKEKLEAEGLFSLERKRKIPKYPEKIGVITSPTGAAVRDIIHVLNRRFPLAKIYLYPSLVQGDGAEANLIEALDYFEKTRLADTLIIGRGGGSIEDLWAFNGELLARKIASITVPVISAVGHETDFTICDFVSDMRAPTPSAAAEIAVPDINELLLWLDGCEHRMKNNITAIVSRNYDKVTILHNSLNSTVEGNLRELRHVISDKYSELRLIHKTITDKKDSAVKILIEKLNALNPLSVISRGYSYVEHEGRVLNTKNAVDVGDKIRVRLSDGLIYATVDGKEELK